MNEEDTLGRGPTSGGDVEVADFLKLPSHPLVSVSMITYNHGPHIRESLDSVLKQQTDFDYEICLGEDGSTDGTREICLEYAQRYPDRIRLFLRDRTNPARQKYRVPHAHNSVETTKACRGKYVALLEGDDYWISAAKLARQVAALEAEPAFSLAAHYVMRIPEGRPWNAYLIPGQPMREFSIEDLLRDRVYVHTSSLLLRYCQDIDWEIFRHTICGDVPMLFCHLLRGKATILPQVMSVYRVHAGGVFTSQSPAAQIEKSDTLWETFRPFVPPALRGPHQMGHIRILADTAAEYRRAGLRSAALESFRKALSLVATAPTFSWSDRLSLAADVAEGLLFPRLRRMRQRLVSKVQAKRLQRVFAMGPET